MKDLLALLPVFSIAAFFSLPLTYQCNRISALEEDLLLYQKALQLNAQHLKQKKAEERKIKDAYETLFTEVTLFYELDPAGAGDWGNTALPQSVALFLQRKDSFSECAACPVAND